MAKKKTPQQLIEWLEEADDYSETKALAGYLADIMYGDEKSRDLALAGLDELEEWLNRSREFLGVELPRVVKYPLKAEDVAKGKGKTYIVTQLIERSITVRCTKDEDPLEKAYSVDPATWDYNQDDSLLSSAQWRSNDQ